MRCVLLTSYSERRTDGVGIDSESAGRGRALGNIEEEEATSAAAAAAAAAGGRAETGGSITERRGYSRTS